MEEMSELNLFRAILNYNDVDKIIAIAGNERDI
jgi:hypothetical protein